MSANEMYVLILEIAALAAVSSVAWCVWCHRRRPPGPWGLPLVGYLPWLDPAAPHLTLTQLSRKYGPVYGIWLGNVYTVVLTDHRTIRKVLAKDVFSGRAPLYLTHGIMNGYGLICAQGDLWKDQRKFVSGCLRNFGAVKNCAKSEKLQELIKSGAAELLQLIKVQSTCEDSIDPLPSLRHCLGNVMNSLVFGCTWAMDNDLWSWLQILQEEGTKCIGVAGPLNFFPFLRFLPKFKHTIDFLIDGKLKTHKVYQSLINERLKLLKAANPSEECRNIIDHFLLEREKRATIQDDSSKFYSDEQFYHLLADIFGAGLDTTLTTLRWHFLFMAAFPHEQSRVHEEIDEVLDGRTPDMEDLKALPFMEASISETQRIRSVVPVGIPHGSLQETDIEGFEIPKGAMIVPLQWALHMDPSVWVNPELYDPGRFIDSEGRYVKPDNFLPFQTGKRMCIGDELARMLLYLFAATVLQKYHITCPVGDRIDLVGECGITLTPKIHRFVFTKRQIKNGPKSNNINLTI